MSIFAGIYSIKQGLPGEAVDQKCIDSIMRSISRSEHHIETWSDDRFFLAKVDIGAFSESAFNVPESGPVSSVATLAGHPFISAGRESSVSRQTHLDVIQSELDAGNTSVLRDCYGTFALCHYHSPDHRLLLSTDRFGSRPLFYHVGKEHIYFSTALRVLEKIRAVPKRIDVQGLAESMAISFPLADRTTYTDIKVLESGQYLVCRAGSVSIDSHFHWDDVAPTHLSSDELLVHAYETFSAAVLRRSSGLTSVAAELSGGLDSRCIVTLLHSLSKKVFVVTWATNGYIDHVLAQQFASVLELNQILRNIPQYPATTDLMRGVQNLTWPGVDNPPDARLVFSGDGGSVGVGYDYLTDERVGWMRSGQVDRMIDFLLAKHTLPRRFIVEPMYRRLHDALIDGISTEIKRNHSSDPGRDLHLYYMKNDQRRHLHTFWENIDLHGVEYALPFYDGQFSELLVSGPVDAFLRHEFYHRWLDRFPAVIKSVAWQTYPGHLECPVPTSASGLIQWDNRRSDLFRGNHRRAFWQCVGTFLRGNIPCSAIRPLPVMAAMALHATRLRSYGYLFKVCNQLCDVRAKCNGDPAFSESFSPIEVGDAV